MMDTSAQYAMVFVYDITEVSAPSLLKSFGISGYTITSRMQGDVVYLMSQHYISKGLDGIYGLPEDYDGTETSAIPPGKIHYDPETEDPGYFLNILAIDASKLKSESESIVAGWASTIYMSKDSLFLTMVKWPEVTMTMMGDVAVATEPADEQPVTTIYRVDVDELSMTVSAKGSVPGLLHDQFSMDESDGYLRVAVSSGVWQHRSNAVYVLDSNLTTVGSITGIAVNETIQSSRFVGDKLYLVTFRQVDPLFVIDLSVPRVPKILGELTIPGFSTYLHPVDAGHILGIGSEGSSVKISLFDVTNASNPREVSKFMVGNNSYTSVGWEHKEVLFDAQKQLLVIPVMTYDPTYWNYSSSFYAFKVSAASGISLRGTISHDSSGYYWYGCDRALYIGDYLYTISGTTVKANLLSDLSDVGELVYMEYTPYYILGAGTVSAAPSE